jgi:hypothetical protein
MQANAPTHRRRGIKPTEQAQHTRLEKITTLLQVIAAGLQAIAAIVAMVVVVFTGNAITKSVTAIAKERSSASAVPTTTQSKTP